MFFTIMTKKPLDINLTKHIQDLYAENYKRLIKDIQGDLNKQIHIHCVHGLNSQHSKDVNSPQNDL